MRDMTTAKPTKAEQETKERMEYASELRQDLRAKHAKDGVNQILRFDVQTKGRTARKLQIKTVHLSYLDAREIEDSAFEKGFTSVVVQMELP